MNYRLLSRLLGIVALLIGAMMLLSLPWAFPALGYREGLEANRFEQAGAVGLAISIAVSLLVGTLLLWWGRAAHGQLFRREAMAAVGLSWILATILGAVPYWASGCYRSAGVRLFGPDQPAQVFRFRNWGWRHWASKDLLTPEQYATIKALIDAGAIGLAPDRLHQMRMVHQTQPGQSGQGLVTADDTIALIEDIRASDPDWQVAIIPPNGGAIDQTPTDRQGHYRIRWIRMGLADCLFESQSGFSTTGATVISDLEDPVLIPHCLLFWRSSTHFLGGLGIIVLFVVILGHGAVGKALMRAEMPGPTKEGATARMQHTAWLFAAIYVGLNIVLAAILWIMGLSPFDAVCHAFGTMATGGFSTYNASVGHFDRADIDYVIVVFMILAGTNFTLIYLMFMGQPLKLLRDAEWKTYMGVILGLTALIVGVGLWVGDFSSFAGSLRYGLFQVVSIMTTTGYGTHDFDAWNSFGRGVLFLLMFVGGCAGSTGGGMKVIRHILFIKILGLEIERSFHPNVVRPLRIGGQAIDDNQLRLNILVYFSLVLIIFIFSWLLVITLEPDSTWGSDSQHKLLDSATAVAANLNNIGPGLGTVGATQNYGHFGPLSKVLFVWLMMLGRLEIFSILVLALPGFWRTR